MPCIVEERFSVGLSVVDRRKGWVLEWGLLKGRREEQKRQ